MASTLMCCRSWNRAAISAMAMLIIRPPCLRCSVFLASHAIFHVGKADQGWLEVQAISESSGLSSSCWLASHAVVKTASRADLLTRFKARMETICPEC